MYNNLFFKIIIVLICFHNSLEAQILNVEKSKLQVDSTHQFIASASFGFRSYNRTAAAGSPIRFLSVNGQFDAAYFSGRHSFQVLNYLDYLDINDDPFTSVGYTHGRVNLMRAQKVSYEFWGQGQYDLLRGLDVRYLFGTGLRFRLLDDPNVRISAGIGAMYEHEKWQDPTVEGRTAVTDIIKSANFISTRWDLKDYMHFNVIVYYQVGRDNLFEVIRHRINSDANLTFTLSKLLSFRVNFTWAYENAPIVPITRFIYSISNGIQFNIR